MDVVHSSQIENPEQYKVSEIAKKLTNFMNENSIFSPFISSLIGLIPNCGASIMITELYLNNMMSFGTMMAGLLTGSGVGILVLIKSNKNWKENLTIIGLLYLIGVVSGIIINLI